MSQVQPSPPAPVATGSPAGSPGLVRSLIRLARPRQWVKSGFVLVGPFYGLPDLLAPERSLSLAWIAGVALLAALAFALASSGCYVFNDLADREADKLHPRKCRRPIAAGHVSPSQARVFGVALYVASAFLTFLIPVAIEQRIIVLAIIVIYVLKEVAYSNYFKHKVVADVMSLSLGFVLRVGAGCAAVVVVPSDWLLTVTFFLSMYLAFGKRLGERRTLAQTGAGAAVAHRRVQERYSDTSLEMFVAVTAVVTLVIYTLYVQEVSRFYTHGFNLLWLTVLPVTYGLLRSFILLDKGVYDDPTELALRDRGCRAAGVMFVALTVALMYARTTGRWPW